MTKHIAPLPDPDGSLLLRELNHRVNNELTSTIFTISAKAVESDDVAEGRAPRCGRPPAWLRRCSQGTTHAGSWAPDRRRKVPPASLLLHHEIPIGPAEHTS